MKNFKKNNPAIEIVKETDHVNILNMWNDDTFMCRFDKNEDLSSFENILLPEQFSAIQHLKENKFEFIYGPIQDSEAVIGRKFEITYNSETFNAYFDTPSDILKKIAVGFREVKEASETRYRNLRLFRSFYKSDKKPTEEAFFSKRVPISFYLEGNLDQIVNYEEFTKTINFYMRFYDRKSPTILTHLPIHDQEKYEEFCHFKSTGFPEHINTVNIEPVLLNLFQIALETANIRMKYIFYYQVLEYCSYYYLNEGLKRSLNNIVKNPDIINNSNEYSKILVEEFKNYFKTNDDRQKLEKLVCDYCSYSDIKNEVLANHEYFSKDLEFDGGFIINAIINNEKEAKNPPKDILKSMIDRIDKIRNVLVHIRESRENKVILPTEKNNKLLIPYLFLIRRIAESIAIKYE